MPEESVKTLLRLVMHDGFPALRDRRCSATSPAPVAASAATPTAASARDGDGWSIDLGTCGGALSIPITHPLQARTLMLSLLNAQLLPAQQCAAALLSPAHCRALARELAARDVAEALFDKRVGQQGDYRVGPEQKAQSIQQWTARTVTGQSTSSEVLAREVNALTDACLSARTVRWHLQLWA